ncbi:hypothetical protein BY996DRAFT_6514379 [Phakopsora pachyrhizi]|nr:hypothetical protein BY996DRAFT_6514379 [Phakopsora pachyrhizi]
MVDWLKTIYKRVRIVEEDDKIKIKIKSPGLSSSDFEVLAKELRREENSDTEIKSKDADGRVWRWVNLRSMRSVDEDDTARRLGGNRQTFGRFSQTKNWGTKINCTSADPVD